MAEISTMHMTVPEGVTADGFGSAIEELVSILATVDETVPMGSILISEMEALVDAGILNSLKYRRLLMEEFIEGKTVGEQAAFFFLCVMTGAVKTVDRMKMACRLIKNTQLKAACMNILNRMVKYNSQKTTAMKFSGHNIAAAFPELSVIGKAMVTEPSPNLIIPDYKNFDTEERRDSPTREITEDRIAIFPILACMQTGQLYLSAEAQALHIKWEKHFWLDIVSAGGAKFSNSWNPRFYRNKSGDRYVIPNVFEVVAPVAPYTVNDLQLWHEQIYHLTRPRERK